MQAPAIAVRDLVVQYRHRKGHPIRAVDALTFTVDPGEVVGFLGPNGAGKSSTLKSLMGFVEPTQGRAEVMGYPAGSLDARRRIGYLPEVAMYYPFLTPRETLRLYGELQGLRGRALHREADELLDLVGLSAAATKQNRSLSKGMLQRVGIAQSLLGSPSVLILDEVTSGLDPVGRRELRDLLRARQRAGATLFFSSHELAEVEMLCDRILLIDRGQLVEERQMEALKDELRQYAFSFRGAVTMVGLTDHLRTLPGGVTQAVFQTKESLLEGLERVSRAGALLIDVVAQEGSLEDYFVDAIGRAA